MERRPGEHDAADVDLERRAANVRHDPSSVSGVPGSGERPPDCTLSIDVEAISLLREGDRSDSLIRTWLHESLHARQPYSSGYLREWQEARGFEEGVVEGLTRSIAVDWLGLRPIIASYDFYVAAYRSLAIVLSVDVERLWRMLWAFPAGEIRVGLVLTAGRILRENGRPSLRPSQQGRLSLFGARHFSSDRANDQPNEQTLVSIWRSVIE